MSSLPLAVSVLGFSWDTTNACSSPRWVCGLPECHLPSLPLVLTGRKPFAWGIPRWFSSKESTCRCRRPRRHSFNPWVEKISWSRKCRPIPVFLLGKFYEQRSLAGLDKEWDTAEHTCSHACMHACTPSAWRSFSREDFPDTHTHTYRISTFMGLLKTWLFDICRMLLTRLQSKYNYAPYRHLNGVLGAVCYIYSA